MRESFDINRLWPVIKKSISEFSKKTVDTTHALSNIPDLLASFKKHEISALLLYIREMILDKIHSEHVSEKVKDYLTDMETCGFYLIQSSATLDNLPDTIKSAYFLSNDNKLYYLNKHETPDPILITYESNILQNLKQTLSIESIAAPTGQTPKLVFKNLKQAQRNSITKLTQHAHEEHIPFVNFEHQPRQIIQLKEIINSLYHGQLAFADLENTSLLSSTDILRIFKQTIPHAYEACYLITHLDIDLMDAFNEEISLLLNVLSLVQTYADKNNKEPDQFRALVKKYSAVHKTGIASDVINLIGSAETYVNEHSEQTDKFLGFIKKYGTIHNVGIGSGIVIDQLQPNTGKIDFNFLTQLTGVLPSYIEQLTSYIKKHSSNVTKQEPTLDKQKIEMLQNDAFQLLNAINSIQDNSALLAFKVIKYVKIIRRVISLSTSILEQTGHMTNASQDLIRDKLHTLKYQYLLQLFALTDKIEDELLLKPGTLSQPLNAQITPLYKELIRYSSKPVNFSEKGEELLTLDDSRFIELRLEETQQRINKANQHLFKAGHIKAALENFFTILEKPKHANKALKDLKESTKEALTRHYLFIKPYVEELNLDLNNAIISALIGLSEPDKRWKITQLLKANKTLSNVSTLLSYKTNLVKRIQSEIATRTFHIELNEAIISNAYKNTHLTLRPYAHDYSVLHVDEPQRIAPTEEDKKSTRVTTLIDKPETLTGDQALDLYKYHEERRSKLIRAQQACAEFATIWENSEKQRAKVPFMALMAKWETNKTASQKPDFTRFFPKWVKDNALSLHQLSNTEKEALKSLYLIFQPYWVDVFCNDAGMNRFDKKMTRSLQENTFNETSGFSITKDHFFSHLTTFNSELLTHITTSEEQRNRYEAIANEKLLFETHTKKLILNDNQNPRANHVIKHTHCSESIAKFRESIYDQIDLFNPIIADRLKPRVMDTLPFPEISIQNKALAESKQLLNFKRLLNGLYHLEQTIIALEKLKDVNNNQYSATEYLNKCLYVKHLQEAYSHLDDLFLLVQEFDVDPYANFIAKELFLNIKNIKRLLLEKSEPYRQDAANIPDIQGEITLDTLWYPLQAFMLIPEYIKASNHNQTLQPKELHDIRVNAKRITINVEKILQSSNSYFKLFLKIPAMYRLFKELKQQLASFAGQSHDAAIKHLNEINTVLFTRILIETDQWEDRIGLNPGQLSGYMKAMLDELYQGFLKPLELKSEEHIQYVTSLAPFEQRKIASSKRATLAQQKQLHNDNTINKLHVFLQRVANYRENECSSLIPSNLDFSSMVRGDLIESYKEIHSIIEEFNGHYQLEKPTALSQKIDAILHESIDKDGLLKMTNIIELTQSVLSHYQGLKTGYQFEIDLARDKNTYLDKLRTEQIELNKQFVLSYTHKAFKKRVETIITRQSDLCSTALKSEYNDKLNRFLLAFKNDVTDKAILTDDIKKEIKNLLHAKMQKFEQLNLKKYAQLDNVLSAIAEFNHYLNHHLRGEKSSVFENTKTLTDKKAKIDELEKLATNPGITIDDRLLQLRTIVYSFSFKNSMMRHKPLTTFSLDWLKRCLVYLLEALRIYTPRHVANLNNLKDAISINPQSKHNVRQFRFFKETPVQYELPSNLGLTAQHVDDSELTQPAILST